MSNRSRKSVEQVFGEVVMSLTAEQQEELIGILHRMNSQNAAAEMAADATPTSASKDSAGANQAQLAMMQTYIDRTPIPNRRNYQLRHTETSALYSEAVNDRVRTLFMAYEYGMAKGYRAAQSVKMPARKA